MNQILTRYENQFENDSISMVLDDYLGTCSLGTTLALRKVQQDNNIRNLCRRFDVLANPVRQQRTESILRFMLAKGETVKIGNSRIRPTDKAPLGNIENHATAWELEPRAA